MPLPQITKKQQLIIILLSRFRFLDRTHIQAHLNHKNHKPILLWLNDLTEKNYLNRIYSKSYGQNTKPAVYSLAANAIRLLNAQPDANKATLHKLYREKERSQAFIDRCLLLASIYLDLTGRTNDKLSYVMFVKADYPALRIGTLLADLNPDAYLVRDKEGVIQDFLLELFDDEPLIRLRQRIKKYLTFYGSNEWEGMTSSDFPTILFICPNKRVLSYVAQYTRKALAQIDEPELRIRVTTIDELKESGLSGKIWEDVP